MNTMPPTSFITALQWAITLSGVAVFILAVFSWYVAHQERIGLKRARQNGSLAAAARLHLLVSSSRVLASALAIAIGAALMFMEDFIRPAGMLAGTGLFAWNMVLVFNLSIEWQTRVTQRDCVERYDALNQIDELVAQRIERTAERFERTAERLEREQERLERTHERIERTHERTERARAIAKE